MRAMSVVFAVGPGDGRWTLLLVAAALVAAVAAVRLVPEAHRGVVTRLGRTRRVVGPGAVFVVPGLDRVERLSMAPVRIEPLVVGARTADHVDVRVEGSAVYRVIDPAAAVAAVPSAFARTADEAEHVLRTRVADVDLRGLLEARETLVPLVQEDLRRLTPSWGVSVLEVELRDVEVRLSSSAARLLP